MRLLPTLFESVRHQRGLEKGLTDVVSAMPASLVLRLRRLVEVEEVDGVVSIDELPIEGDLAAAAAPLFFSSSRVLADKRSSGDCRLSAMSEVRGWPTTLSDVSVVRLGSI